VPILLLSRLELSNKNARFTIIGRFETAKFVSLCPRNLLGLAVMRGWAPFSRLLCQAPNDMLGIDKELNDHRKSMGRFLEAGGAFHMRAPNAFGVRFGP
jgi:hypothetical protein